MKTQVELVETILLLIANFLDLDILLLVDFLDPREGEGGGVLRLHTVCTIQITYVHQLISTY